MKLLKTIAAILLIPLALSISATADEGKGKKATSSKKPSLTYYYFDG